MELEFLIWEATESSVLPSGISWGAALGVVRPGVCFLIVGVGPCRFDLTQCSNMPTKRDTASSNEARQGGKSGWTTVSSECPYLGKPIELLNKREFRNCLYFPNGISVQLVEGDLMPTEKVGYNVIYFTKEQFNAGLHFPIPSLFKQFLYYTQIPPAYIHPNIVWVLMGCNILNMLPRGTH